MDAEWTYGCVTRSRPTKTQENIADVYADPFLEHAHPMFAGLDRRCSDWPTLLDPTLLDLALGPSKSTSEHLKAIVPCSH